MQFFGNVATVFERKESRTTGKVYYQGRVCEAQRGVDKNPLFYTVRIMKGEDPNFAKGAFIRTTGRLVLDCYLGRDGKPTGTLLVIAFEATKISKPSAAAIEAGGNSDENQTAAVESVTAAVSPAVSSSLQATPAPTTVPSSVSAKRLSQEAQPVPAKQQFASMQLLPSFALPSPVASPWGMSFGAPVQAK